MRTLLSRRVYVDGLCPSPCPLSCPLAVGCCAPTPPQSAGVWVTRSPLSPVALRRLRLLSHATEVTSRLKHVFPGLEGVPPPSQRLDGAAGPERALPAVTAAHGRPGQAPRPTCDPHSATRPPPRTDAVPAAPLSTSCCKSAFQSVPAGFQAGSSTRPVGLQGGSWRESE